MTGLEQFQKKRAEWLVWLDGNDRHAIHSQMWSLLRDYALFRTIRDFRREAADNPCETVGFNPSVLGLLESGFVAKQAMGIRCLVDKSKDRKTQKSDVFSLRNLLDDLKQNRGLMTRENYLACHSLPYDFVAARELRDEQLTSPEHFHFYKGINPEPEQSEGMHRLFDELSGVSPESRKCNDLVSMKWFDPLESKLALCEDLWKFATKFIAHAADIDSRDNLTNTQTGVTLNRIEGCLKALCYVSECVSIKLLRPESVLLCRVAPLPFDAVENLDKGWIPSSSLDKAQSFWNQNCSTIDQWNL